MSDDRNLFLLGRSRNDEDQLTEMLFWLVEGEPAVQAAVISLAVGSLALDPGEDLETHTQYAVPGGYIDGVILGADLKIAIESKLGSGYHSAQLTKYIDWLAGVGLEAPT